jgi:hypothetical protein
MNFEDITPAIENILILDSQGKRIAVKYYGDSRCVWDDVRYRRAALAYERLDVSTISQAVCGRASIFRKGRVFQSEQKSAAKFGRCGCHFCVMAAYTTWSDSEQKQWGQNVAVGRSSLPHLERALRFNYTLISP